MSLGSSTKTEELCVLWPVGFWPVTSRPSCRQNNPHSTSQTDFIVFGLISHTQHNHAADTEWWMNCRTPSCISRGIVACSLSTIWQELSYSIILFCLLTRVDPQIILVIRTCSTVLDFDTVFFFFFFFFFLFSLSPSLSLLLTFHTLYLCSATPRPIDGAMSRSTSRSPPRRSEDAWNNQKDASVSHCRVRCVLLAVCVCVSVDGSGSWYLNSDHQHEQYDISRH